MKKTQFGFLLLGLVLLVISCSQPPAVQEEAEAADSAETPQESAPSPGGSGGWLDGIPEVVPSFTNGTFSNQSYKFKSGAGTVYSLYYENVTVENAREYLGKLREKGFSVNEETSSPGELSASGGLRQGEGNIGYSFSLQQNGHVDLTFNVVEKYQ